MSKSKFDGIIKKWTSMSSPGEKLSRRRFMTRLSAIAATLAVAGVALRDAFADCDVNTGCPGPNTCDNNSCDVNVCGSKNTCNVNNSCTTSNSCAKGNVGHCEEGNACAGVNTCLGVNVCPSSNQCTGTTDMCDVNKCTFNTCNLNQCTADDECFKNTCGVDIDCGWSDISCYPIGHKCTKVDNAPE